MLKRSVRMISNVFLGTWMLFANGCDGFVVLPQKQSTEPIVKQKVVVIAPEHELIFSLRSGFKNELTLTGIDFNLVQGFADFAGYELTIHPFPTREKALAAFETGFGDLLIGRWPTQRTVPGTVNGPIFESSQLALYCPKNMKIAHANDLANVTIYTRPIDHIAFQQLKSALYPKFLIRELNGADSTILPTTLGPKAGCAMMEERLGDFEKKFYPQIEKVYTFAFEVDLVWKIREGKSELFNSLRRWFQLASRRDLVVPVIYRYSSSLDALADNDFLTFQRNTQQRLQNYLDLFRTAGRQNRIPWTLLAAVGYQESHLDNDAISFTGVQGIMQITQATAQFLGMNNRNDPQEAIPAAGKYLGWIYSQWPKEVPYIERVKLTLASYNMGYQHVRDVQDWLIKQKRNPYSWKDLKYGFASKANPELSSEFAWGIARGHETIHFVERVLAFENLFKRKYAPSPIQDYFKKQKKSDKTKDVKRPRNSLTQEG